MKDAPKIISSSFVPTAPGVVYDIQLHGDKMHLFIHNGPEYEKDGVFHTGGVVAELIFDEGSFLNFLGKLQAAKKHYDGLAHVRRWPNAKNTP
jgi:hypothetical protein